MREYAITAVVLAKDHSGEQDNLVTLFSESEGKTVAKTKSTRKITSKLAGHIEPGSIIHGRIVEKNQALLVDALKIDTSSWTPVQLLSLSALLAPHNPEPLIWPMLKQIDSHKVRWKEVLQILGWGDATAQCILCNAQNIYFFHIPSQEFYCQQCTLYQPVPLAHLISLG
jgi:recombinational DNA repair protein (RecF pathway)